MNFLSDGGWCADEVEGDWLIAVIISSSLISLISLAGGLAGLLTEGV